MARKDPILKALVVCLLALATLMAAVLIVPVESGGGSSSTRLDIGNTRFHRVGRHVFFHGIGFYGQSPYQLLRPDKFSA